jgi:hypothetical protein
LRHADSARLCLLAWLDRKWADRRQSDAFDPSATLARPAKVLSMPVFAPIKERV